MSDASVTVAGRAARCADGTLKKLSMEDFGHEYATAAAGIDPAPFGQDIR